MATQWQYGTLWTNEDQIVHTMYFRSGLHQESASFSYDRWSECLAILGEVGWEAISVRETSNPTIVIWWLKRAIHPNNENLSM